MARRSWRACQFGAALCVSLALLFATYTSASMNVRAAGSGTASSCGGPPATLPTTTGAGPSMSLARATGPAGMSETLRGAGWPVGARILLDLDVPQPDGTAYIAQSDFTSTFVAADSTFSFPTFDVPDPGGCGNGAGSRVDFVAHTPDNTYAAKAAFTYTAQPTLLPNGVPNPRAGTPFPLQGSNWEPQETVTITFSIAPPEQQQNGTTPPQPLPNGTLRTNADAQGNLSASYTLPATLVPRSLLVVQATGTGPLYGTVAAMGIELLVLPAVMPSIALSRTSGTAADAIAVRGAKWYPGDTVNITYCRGQNVQPDLGGLRVNALPCQPELTETLTTLTVDAHGTFTTRVHLPADAKTGLITIQAIVPNDVFGLTVYAQGAAYTILPPPLPWSRVHPHLAFGIAIVKPALPALALAVLLLAVFLWRRLRSRRAAPPVPATPPVPAAPAPAVPSTHQTESE